MEVTGPVEKVHIEETAVDHVGMGLDPEIESTGEPHEAAGVTLPPVAAEGLMAHDRTGITTAMRSERKRTNETIGKRKRKLIKYYCESYLLTNQTMFLN